MCLGRIHGAPSRGHVPLRFGGGEGGEGGGESVVRRMGTQQQLVCLHFPNYFNI